VRERHRGSPTPKRRTPVDACSVPDVDRCVVDGVAVREWGDPDEPGVLLWPGLGSVGAYFAPLAGALAGRAVAADPPGFGSSPSLERYTYARLLDAAGAVFTARGCRACVAHSLGGYLALGLAARPPAGLRAVVLIDGGFLSAGEMAELGVPVTGGRAQLIAWLEQNRPRFPDWDAAFGGFAAMVGGEVTVELQAYVREILVEVDGEISDLAPAARLADLLLAVVGEDVVGRARSIEVPTLLIACGQPPESRAIKARAWQAFASAAPLIELHVADDWGHNPILQAPHAAASLISDWLAAHL
jgi:pimeloyl-ACP methyl ester carboxylesterase